MDDAAQMDAYDTLGSSGEAKLKEKGSVFLAFAVPVEDAEAADEQLAAWRKQYYDATHVGSARRLAPPPDGEERYDDDGEPHGSTGPPILNAIKGADLWGVLVGVVRYYGGTKLGVGGLIRAYGGAAEEAIAAAKRKTIEITGTIEVEVPHDRAGAVYALADKLEAKVSAPRYTEEGLILPMTLLASRVENAVAEVVEATAGRAEVRVVQ